MAATSHALLFENSGRAGLAPQNATGLLLARYLKPRTEHSRDRCGMAPFQPDQLQAASRRRVSEAGHMARPRSPLRRQRRTVRASMIVGRAHRPSQVDEKTNRR